MHAALSRAILWMGLSGLLIACSSGSDSSSSDDLVNSVTNSSPQSVTVSGRVGSPSLRSAEVRLVDSSGGGVLTATSDDRSAFSVEVASDEAYPLTILVEGGDDAITGGTAEFEMMATIRHAATQTVHVSPLSTLAAQMETCGDGAGPSWSSVLVNYPMTLAENRDPLRDPVAVSNAAELMLANEGLREIIRRSRQGLLSAGEDLSAQSIIEQAACDLADDGHLNGSDASVSDRLIVTVRAAEAAVLVELIAGQLHIDRQDARPWLDATLAEITGSSSISIDDAATTGAMIAQARKAMTLFTDEFGDTALIEIATMLEGDPEAVADAVQASLAAEHQTALWDLSENVALADETTVANIVARAETQATALPPVVSLAASESSVESGANVVLSWSSADADSCTASGDWTGPVELEGTFDTGPLTVSSTFTLECVGLGGVTEANAQVAVITPGAVPVATLSADELTILEGDATTLSWTSENAAACEASGDWSGTKPLIGSESTGPLSVSSTFTLTCTNDDGSDASSLTITVEPAVAPVPVIGLSSDFNNVSEGGTATLSWTTSDATSCSASGAWSGDKPVSGSETVGPLDSSSTFTLTCDGPGGSASESVNVTVDAAPNPAPTVSLQAASASVAQGAATTLTWDSTNADSCSASGAWSGAQATSGSASTGSLNVNSSFTLTCTGAGGSASDTVTVAVTVGQQQPPTVSLSASPTSVSSGQTTTLSWSSSAADSCSASGAWSGSKATNGSETSAALNSNATFTLTCSNAGGSASDSVSVSVGTADEPTLSFSVADPEVNSGSTTTLTWSSENTSSCTASGGWTGSRATSGSESIGPLSQTTSYTLDCSGAGGNVISIVSVVVNASIAVSWQAPTENVDGTSLTDLDFYTIYYGSSSGNYPDQVDVNNPNATSHTLSVPQGDYYIVMTATDGDGDESGYSNEVLRSTD